MSAFDTAIPVILKHEGGWVSNPADPGGETNFGISTLMVKRLQADNHMTNAQVAQLLGVPEASLYTPGYMKTMVVDAAKTIYKKYFWDAPAYWNIADQNMATKSFDVCVNCGQPRAGKMIQLACNTLGAGLTVDGSLGNKSFEAINKLDAAKLILAFRDEQVKYYNNLVAGNPSLGIFLKNWLKRAAWIDPTCW